MNIEWDAKKCLIVGIGSKSECIFKYNTLILYSTGTKKTETHYWRHKMRNIEE